MPPRQRTQDRNLVVLRAASEVFLAHGFSGATTDMIQAVAGVSKATVYARYPTKEALFLAVIEHECAAFSEKLRSIAIACEPGDVAKALHGVGRAYLGILLSPVALALFRVVVADAPRFPQIGRAFYLAGPQPVAAIVRNLLEHAALAGSLDLQSVVTEAATAAFLSLLRSDAQLEVLTHPDNKHSQAQIDRCAQQAVTIFLQAFSAQNPSA